MSFGLYKKGVNNTDKRLIKRFTAAGWPVDKISNKLSVVPELVAKVIAIQASGGGKPDVVEKETAVEVESIREDALDEAILVVEQAKAEAAEIVEAAKAEAAKATEEAAKAEKEPETAGDPLPAAKGKRAKTATEPKD